MSKTNIKKIIAKYPWISVLIIILAVVIYVYSAFFFIPVKDGEAEVHFINVGQGDAALILTDSASVLIDTGTTESGKKVASYIKTRTDSLDYMILSHPHEDHIGGADDIFENVTVKNVVMPDHTANSTSFDRLLNGIESSGAEVIPAVKGLTFSAGDLHFEILSPTEGKDYEETNDVSAVVRVTYGKTSFLFTGDAEAIIEKELVSGHHLSHCDVLKVGHHGSSTSSTEDFLRAISPDIAVISCSKDNSYGHPHREVIKRLNDIGSQILRTDTDGTIVIISDGNGVRVK